MNAQRLRDALVLYGTEPSPSQAGGNAGKRQHEGIQFRDAMRALLETEQHVVETALGKSSKGVRLDGNASERMAYKMLAHKRDPLMGSTYLVLAFNIAFTKYDTSILSELQAQAAYLNGLDSRAPIITIATPAEYKHYINRVFR